MAWQAEVDRKRVFVKTTCKKTGREISIPVVKISVAVFGPHGGMVFGVGRGANGRPVFTDSRETHTGAAALTLRGPLPGEAYCKQGPVRKLTPTAWAAEVSRLIGAERAGEVLAEIG